VMSGVTGRYSRLFRKAAVLSSSPGRRPAYTSVKFTGQQARTWPCCATSRSRNSVRPNRPLR
jgi:hypothetical protein